MGSIVCATRGGAGSRAVQLRAIEYARERREHLVFLYVIDEDHLESFDEHLRPAARDEILWLGRALMNIAQNRAENDDVASEFVIREGIVADEICRFVEERSASLLLLGAPRLSSAADHNDDSVEKFAQPIAEQSGVPVEIIRPEPIHDGVDDRST